MENEDCNKIYEKLDELNKVVNDLRVEFAGLKGKLYGVAAIISFCVTAVITGLATFFGAKH